MEIKGTQFLQGQYAVSLGNSAELQNRQRAGGSQTDSTRQGDTVSVSQDAILLTEAHRTAQNTPDVRADKVEALRIQVANGSYKPDSQLIAANLIREEPGLFQI